MSETTEQQSYEQAIVELETIVTTMETGQLPLEQAVTAYKRGAELIKFCQQALTQAEQKVQVLDHDTLITLESAES